MSKKKIIKAWSICIKDELWVDGPFHGDEGGRMYLRESKVDAQRLINDIFLSSAMPPPKPIEVEIHLPPLPKPKSKKK